MALSRLDQKICELQTQYDDLSQKIERLRKALVIETDPASTGFRKKVYTVRPERVEGQHKRFDKLSANGDAS